MKRMLMIKRKGFNYYTDYTELYLHRAFQNYGYSVVRDVAESELSVFVYLSETEKYIKMTSTFFDELNESDIAQLCDLFSKAFKSEVIITEITAEYEYDLIGAYEFMISKSYSAYDEPVYLIDEPPKLKRKTSFIDFKTNINNSMGFVNVGGRLSGINVTFDFTENMYDFDLIEAYISRFNGSSFPRQEILFKKENGSFKADIDFLEIEKGINPKSAVLRGKKRATEEEKYGFRLGVLPVCKENVILNGTLTITSGNVEIFKCNI